MDGNEELKEKLLDHSMTREELLLEHTHTFIAEYSYKQDSWKFIRKMVILLILIESLWIRILNMPFIKLYLNGICHCTSS